MTGDILWSLAPQGSDEWLAARVGRITGSLAKLTRDRKKDGSYSSAAMGYAMDLAREREGGTAPDVYVNAAMRKGTEEEPRARMHMEIAHGLLIETVGFAYTEDGKFGVSVDGLIGDDETWECKTMVSSATLFKALVYRDVSEYRDQVLMGLWLLHRKRCRLTLWAPDLPIPEVTVVIERNDDEIDALVFDLVTFDRLVEGLRADLRKSLGLPPLTAPADAPPWDAPAAPAPTKTPAPAATELPDLFPA